MAEITSKELAVEVCKALADKRGKDIIALYVREKTDLCENFILTGDFNTEDFTTFAPVTSLGYALVNDTAHEFKTFRHNPVAIDNIVYREGHMTPEAFGMIESDASDHNLLWCRFELN